MSQPHRRLLLLAPLFFPNYSGAAIQYLRYAPGLHERGYDMTVFTLTPKVTSDDRGTVEAYHRVDAAIGTLLPPETVEGVPVQRIQAHASSQGQRELTYLRALIDYCRNPETRPDIVQSLTGATTWPLWRRRFRQLGIPLVHSHMLLNDMAKHPLKRAVQRYYWPSRLPPANAFVASSSVARDVFKAQYRVKQPVEIIPNGVDTQRFRPAASAEEKLALRRQLGLPEQAVIVLFVGSISHRKGADTLASAWAECAPDLPEAFLVLVGPAETDAISDETLASAPKVRSVIAQSGAGDRVKFTGTVNNVEAYFRTADVFVFPSRREGMGNVVMEAFSSEVATILTPFLGLPQEFGQPDRQYVLVEQDATALAQGIRQLIQDPERRTCLGRSARAWALEHLDLEVTVNKFANLYTTLLH